MFCAECGSADLSTPGPPASLLHHLSGLALYGLASVLIAVAIAAFVLAVLASINWQELVGPLVCLCLMLGFLYWTTTLLPGPIRKVGKAAGMAVFRAIAGSRDKDRGNSH